LTDFLCVNTNLRKQEILKDFDIISVFASPRSAKQKQTELSIMCHSKQKQTELSIMCHSKQKQTELSIMCHSKQKQTELSIMCHSQDTKP
jgi:hypothetical protein